jgi:cytochrome c oxidase subunit IV
MAGSHHTPHGVYDNDQSDYTHPDVHTHHDEAHGVAVRKKIWFVFILLALITAVEFVIAFVMPRGTGRNVLFIGMTLVKAGYIVAYFMHLKDEVRSLMVTILLPMLFILWLILALLIEGSFYGGGWFNL